MSTPQNPDDGNTPQDPSNPQNPYGPGPTTPPPPPPTPQDPTYPPPATPIPAAPSPYGDPYPQPAPTPPPPYGQPAAQPVPGQPYLPPGAPPQAEAGKGMAITALVISFFGCTCLGAIVSIILSIVVLLRGKDGRNHGKGLAIAAIVVSVLSLIAGLAIAGIIAYAASTFETVDDLKVGQCFNADGLNDSSSGGVTNVNTVSCSSSHDAEVLATGTLTKDEVSNFNSTACDQAILDAGKQGLIVPPITYTGLSDNNPDVGDKFVCIAYSQDGSKLTSKLGG